MHAFFRGAGSFGGGIALLFPRLALGQARTQIPLHRAGRQPRPRLHRNYSRFMTPTIRGSVFGAFAQRGGPRDRRWGRGPQVSA
jgi:hypothetical protein